MSGILYYFSEFFSLLSDKSFAVVTLILLTPFLLAFVVCASVFMVKGFKRGFWGGLLALAASVTAFLLSVVGAKLLSLAIAAISRGKLLEAAKTTLARFTNGAQGSPERLAAFAEGLISAFLALILYFFFFICLLFAFKKLFALFTKRRSGEKRRLLISRIFGLLVGFVDALLVALLLFAPLYTFIYDGTQTLRSAVDDVRSSPVVELLLEGQEEQVKAFEEKLNVLYRPIVNCPAPLICSRPVFDFGRSVFGLYSYDGRLYNAYDELEDHIESTFSPRGEPAGDKEKDGLTALQMLETVFGRKDDGKEEKTSPSVGKLIEKLMLLINPGDIPSATPLELSADPLSETPTAAQSGIQTGSPTA